MLSVTPIKVGIPVSLSGQFQVQGRQALAGVQAWAKDINSGGGMRVGANQPRPVELAHYDDSSSREAVRTATQKLIDEDRVDLLFGPYSSVLTLAAAEVAESYGKLLWNQGGASPGVYQRGYRNIVGILTPATDYLAGLLDAVRVACPDVKSLLVAKASRGTFPKDVCSGVEERASGLGFEAVRSIEFDPQSSDFSEVLAAVNDGRPDVLVAVGRIENDLELASQLARSNTSLGAVAVVAAGVNQFWDRLGQQADGFIGPSQWELGADYAADFGPTGSQVAESLRQASNAAGDYPATQAYAAGVVVQRCLQEVNQIDDTALREAAASLDFSTFFGRFKIDSETGKQIGRSTLLVQWQGGRKVVVWPPSLATAPLRYPWRP